MESSKKSKKSDRREFLRNSLALGTTALVGAGCAGGCSTPEAKGSGEKVKVMTTEGKLMEIDPAHLRQVLWNLLANAAEAIEDTGIIKIIMGTERRGQVRLLIRDSGCGIPNEKLKLIFDPFYTTKARGTGLGLSIVHSILESYGYRVDAESRVGEGTTFILHLKRVHSPG